MIPWGEDYLYAYADGDKITYATGGSDKRIGQFKAFFLGMPSKWSGHFLLLAMILVPVAFFAPVIAAAYRRFTHTPQGTRPTLSLYHRCICMLLACTFLIGPQCFQTLARGDTQYTSLGTDTWGSDGKTIDYLYDANGSVVKKTTKSDGTTISEEVVYDYNLQGRLEKVTTTPFTAGVPDATDSVVEYTYNPDGIRTESYSYDITNGSTKSDEQTTLYLIDPANHTGYAQVLSETVYDKADPGIIKGVRPRFSLDGRWRYRIIGDYGKTKAHC